MPGYIIGPNSILKLNGTDISNNARLVELPSSRARIPQHLSGVSSVRYAMGREDTTVSITLVHDDTVEDLINKARGLDDFVFFFHPDSTARARYSMSAQVADIMPASAGIGERALSRITLVPSGPIHRGLMLLNDFQEGSGQVLTDYSGNGFDSELGSTSGVDTNDPTWATTPTRLSFTTDDYTTVGDQTDFDSPEATAIVAVKLDATNDPGTHWIINRVSYCGLYQNGTDWNAIGYTAAGNGTATFAVSDTSWHVLAGVFEIVGADMVMSLYLDGVLKDSATVASATTLSPQAAEWRYGSDWVSANLLEGDIIRGGVFNRALQPNEIADYYYDWREYLAGLGVTLP